VSGGHKLGDWFFNIMAKNNIEEKTMLTKKLSALKTLLEQMEVPERRRDVENISNVRWLARNLAVQNKEHPMFETTQRTIVWVLRNAATLENKR